MKIIQTDENLKINEIIKNLIENYIKLIQDKNL